MYEIVHNLPVRREKYTSGWPFFAVAVQYPSDFNIEQDGKLFVVITINEQFATKRVKRSEENGKKTIVILF